MTRDCTRNLWLWLVVLAALLAGAGCYERTEITTHFRFEVHVEDGQPGQWVYAMERTATSGGCGGRAAACRTLASAQVANQPLVARVEESASDPLGTIEFIVFDDHPENLARAMGDDDDSAQPYTGGFRGQVHSPPPGEADYRVTLSNDDGTSLLECPTAQWGL